MSENAILAPERKCAIDQVFDASFIELLELVPTIRIAHADACVQINPLSLGGTDHIIFCGKRRNRIAGNAWFGRQVVVSQNDVLRRRHGWHSVRRI